MILAYMLPTGSGKFTLWCPEDMRIGEIGEARTVVLSPYPVSGDIGLLFHDYVYRFRARRGLPKRYGTSYWFRMLWGLIYLLGLQDLEDLLCGLYLLVGCPLLSNWAEGIWKRHAAQVGARFDSVAYMPEVEVVISPRLQELSTCESSVDMLHYLDELGLRQLVGFYRRVAWSGRWETGPPTGIGTFHYVEGNLRPIGC